MTPLSLSHPLASAIHARPEQPIAPVWVFSPDRRTWCVLRYAEPAHDAVALCLAPLPAGPLEVRTTQPIHSCPACETELAAMTPGAAVAVESSRTTTARLRPAMGIEDCRDWEEG